MIELVIVIVVFGIVAMISSEIIATIYERYLISRTQHIIETKTSLALLQISNRLQFRIKESAIAKRSGTSTITPLESSDNSYQIIEWIGYDNDGLNGAYDGSRYVPGWSGFADLLDASSNSSGLRSPGSRFDFEDNILYSLSDKEVNLSGSTDHPALIFKEYEGEFNVSLFGWNHSADHNYSLRVHRDPNIVDRLIFDDTPEILYEHYHLSWTAYALVPEGDDCSASVPTDCNLTLYYNFRPWENEVYTDGRKTVLLDHITLFRFKGVGRAIHLKICASDPVFDAFNDNETVSICKERLIH